MHTDTWTLSHPLTSTWARAHTLTHAHTHAHAHTHTHTHTHSKTHHTHTHKHTRPADERVAATAGSPVSPMLCSATPPPPPPLHQPMPKVTISETQVKALRKRCVLRLDLKDVRDGDNRVCIGTEFHTQGLYIALRASSAVCSLAHVCNFWIRSDLLFLVKPVLNWANVCLLNILWTLRRTMICFLIELLVCRIWFGQSKLYFILIWLVMRCKLRSELVADAQQTAWSKM